MAVVQRRGKVRVGEVREGFPEEVVLELTHEGRLGFGLMEKQVKGAVNGLKRHEGGSEQVRSD